MHIEPNTENQSAIPKLEEVRSLQDVSNDAAVQICLTDYRNTKAWLEQYYFTTRWLITDVLYQSPPNFKNWEGTNLPKSFIRKFTVATHTNAVKNKVLTGFFYEDPPFLLREYPSLDSTTKRAIETVLSAQLEQGCFRQEVKLGFHSAILFGTGIWKRSYVIKKKIEWEYKRRTDPVEIQDAAGNTRTLPTKESDEFEKVKVEKWVAYPKLESCDIRRVFPDTGCRVPNIRQAKQVIHEMEMTYNDLCEKADEVYFDEDGKEHKRYMLPSEEEFKKWFEPPVQTAEGAGTETYQMNTNYVHHASPIFQPTTADPLNVPLKVLERWDNGKVITVILGDNGCGYLIRNEANPDGEIPFYSLNWWDIQDAMWGIGYGVCIGTDQMLQQGLENAAADIATLSTNTPLLRLRGANINSQQSRARLGGFIDVDIPDGKGLSIKDTLTPMDLPKIQPEVLAVLQSSEARTEQTSGASEQLTMGTTPPRGKTSLGRTATGAGAWQSAADNRLAGFIEDFNNNVFMPWLWKMHELNCQFMPMSALRELLNQELGDAFKVDEDKFLNSRSKIKNFEVLAGSHLAVRQQIAQFIPFILQYGLNPALQQQLAQIAGKYIDVEELLHMAFDMSGAKNYYSIVKKLTDEMMQRMQANSPAGISAQRAKAAAAQSAQKEQGKKDLQDQKDTAQLVRDLSVENVKRSNQFDVDQIERANGELDRQAIEQSASAENVTGLPGGQGFGSVEVG